MELATDEVCTVVGKSDLDGDGSAEELAEEGNSSCVTSCTTEVDIMTSQARDAQVSRRGY